MLRVNFGACKNEVYNTEMFYENQYDKNWVMDEFAKRVIADIDDSAVLEPDVIQNDIFGTFGSKDLSAGVKTLLLIRNLPNRIFNISNCGDNCAKYILELASERDIKVTLHHAMDFGDDFELKVINEGRRKIISDKKDYLLLAHHYLRREANEG